MDDVNPQGGRITLIPKFGSWIMGLAEKDAKIAKNM